MQWCTLSSGLKNPPRQNKVNKQKQKTNANNSNTDANDYDVYVYMYTYVFVYIRNWAFQDQCKQIVINKHD